MYAKIHESQLPTMGDFRAMAKAADTKPQQPTLSPEQRRRDDLLMAGLDLLDQAIAVFDATPKLVTWNKALLRLLDFPESLVKVGTPFEAFVRFNAERGEYGEGDMETLIAARMASARSFQPHYVERMRPNGRMLAVRGVPIPNLGFVSLWTDITEQRRAEAMIQEHNAQLEARVRERTSELEQANREIDQIAGALRLSEGPPAPHPRRHPDDDRPRRCRSPLPLRQSRLRPVVRPEQGEHRRALHP